MGLVVQKQLLWHWCFAAKKILEAQNRGHVVIAPAPSAPMLGAISGNTYSTYWANFYDAVRDGAAVSAPIVGQPTRTESEGGTPPKDLKVLHLHHYIAPRDILVNNIPVNAPMETVAEGAYGLKLGIDWFRQRYNKIGNQQIGPLDMDILLSETGPDWRYSLEEGNVLRKWAWAGGWNNFRDGLSWWNSWLCWMMRRAPLASECNLANCPNGDRTDAHALYACIHTPDDVPYSTRALSDSTFWTTSTIARNQIFFNADNWSVGNESGKVFIDSPQLNPPISGQPNFYGRYQKSFSAFEPTNWDAAPGTPSTTPTAWRIGPLAACYKVWSQVATDLLTTTFGAGWYANSQAGVIGETTIDLPIGYSTVYFPIIKSLGTFADNTQFNVTWRKAGRPDYVFGYLGADSLATTEFPDSKIVSQIRYNFNTGVYGPLVPI
ncbi:MAG: hypothetical protein HC853_17485, partial [Anaerolineae bacterium]|nr:hypothetical protein [Anaerolineae bacterium]